MAAMRARTGCLGCVGRLAGILLVGVVCGSALIIAIEWVFTPWAFYLGGQFHPLGVWQGAARVHAASGDYTLYLWLSPSRGRRYNNLPYMKGWGYLCTPKGERYALRTTASMPSHPSVDTNGFEMRVDMERRPWYWNFIGYDARPRLSFRGRWQNPDLVLNDGGTLSSAFLPDGTLYTGPTKNQPRGREPAPVVFHLVPWTAFFADCRSAAY
jgi:hypothetical protein